MEIRKCPSCKKYTMNEVCPFDKSKTENLAYRFSKIRDAPQTFQLK